MIYSHVPVMLSEVMKYLAPSAGGRFLDGTLGGAGYTLAIAAKVGEAGKVLGIDLDELAIKHAQQEIAVKKLNNIVLVQDNFKNLRSIAAANFGENARFDGIVFDLGLSSAQLDDETRGFSFKGDRPLKMAFGSGVRDTTHTADIVNHYSLPELIRIFREYGEEKRAYQLAKAIIAARRLKKIKTTADLVAIIEQAIPFRFYSKIHPATRIFQALRMETNNELTVLSEVLPDAVSLLKKNGRLVIVSFHSGEDRIVKRFLKSAAEAEKLLVLTKKPLVPTEVEMKNNPRARSAKLRAAIKIG